jgi:transposase
MPFDGCNQLYEAQRKRAPILEAACWHGRRKFDLVKQGEAPIASETMRRIVDMLFKIERSINGKPPAQRLVVRRERSRPLISELEIWIRQQRYRPPRTIPPRRSTTFSTAGQLSPASSTMAASVLRTTPLNERCVAVGRKNWTGSDAGGLRAPTVYT